MEQINHIFHRLSEITLEIFLPICSKFELKEYKFVTAIGVGLILELE